MKKPEPTPISVVCTLCGLAWDRHPDKATALDCIDLLKADLASNWSWTGGWTQSTEVTGGSVPINIPVNTWTSN